MQSPFGFQFLLSILMVLSTAYAGATGLSCSESFIKPNKIQDRIWESVKAEKVEESTRLRERLVRALKSLDGERLNSGWQLFYRGMNEVQRVDTEGMTPLHSDLATNSSFIGRHQGMDVFIKFTEHSRMEEAVSLISFLLGVDSPVVVPIRFNGREAVVMPYFKDAISLIDYWNKSFEAGQISRRDYENQDPESLLPMDVWFLEILVQRMDPHVGNFLVRRNGDKTQFIPIDYEYVLPPHFRVDTLDDAGGGTFSVTPFWVGRPFHVRGMISQLKKENPLMHERLLDVDTVNSIQRILDEVSKSPDSRAWTDVFFDNYVELSDHFGLI